jgi:leucine dehydrogenase
MALAERLASEGALLVVADVNDDRVRLAVDQLGAVPVRPSDIATTPCDVLAPCALGATLNDTTVPLLHATVIAGGANNQLARPEHGAMLSEREVLYAPDYVINGGGIIRVAGQIYGWTDAEIERRTLAIADTLGTIFRRADAERAPTSAIADRIAKERIARGAHGVVKAAE